VLPEFLCIGAFKAGTTWIYRNIQAHPAIKMPPYKEIYYFHTPPLSRSPLITHLLSGDRFERRRLRLILTHYLPRGRRHLSWFVRYLLLPPGDEWYASLFPQHTDQISGDVTPAYARLGRGAVRHAATLLPQAKIVYCLRNPIERTWSQVAMYFANWQRGLDQTSDPEIEGFLEKGIGFRDSNYARTLELWETFYPSHQIYVAFFDQLVHEPRTFLLNLYRFLELEASDRFIPGSVYQKINPRQYPAIPDRFARYLARQYIGSIELLHRRLQSEVTAGWLESAERLL